MRPGKPYKTRRWGKISTATSSSNQERTDTESDGDRYPTSVIRIPNERTLAGLHPTQKPVKLMEYLVRTFTDAGDVVLDPFAGSGTTGEACVENHRRCVLIERDPEYAAVIDDRFKLSYKR